MQVSFHVRALMGAFLLAYAMGGALPAAAQAAGPAASAGHPVATEAPAVAASGAGAPSAEPQAAPQPAAPLSHNAQLAYQGARDKLVQIRTLLRNSDTQASVGSGFFVSRDGLIITNFHVASQLALEPERYHGVYAPVDGQEAPLQLLAFDVLHDLALLRAVPPAGGNGSGTSADFPFLEFRDAASPLSRGERIYSLGNPKDIGFAVTEGAYNGLALRSFHPRIFFGGAINPGMSGGPVLDDAGRVVGVNVSKRRDGEQLSFLVPGEFARALLASGAKARPVTQPAYAEVTRQLLAHQEQLTQRFLSAPLKLQRHGNYGVPVLDDMLARCWGSGRGAEASKVFDLERTDCTIDSYLYAGDVTTGYIELRYEAYEAPRMGALRFAQLLGRSFANEPFAVNGNRRMTAAECNERYIDRGGMAMRAVVCANAYRKYPGLYDVSVLVSSLNQPTRAVQGRLDAHGVSFDNGLRLVARYLEAFRWEGKP